MADNTPDRRLRVVKVRLMGHPDDVDTAAARIAQTFPTGPPSPAYPNRRQPDTLRVYLEVTPE